MRLGCWLFLIFVLVFAEAKPSHDAVEGGPERLFRRRPKGPIRPGQRLILRHKVDPNRIPQEPVKKLPFSEEHTKNLKEGLGVEATNNEGGNAFDEAGIMDWSSSGLETVFVSETESLRNGNDADDISGPFSLEGYMGDRPSRRGIRRSTAQWVWPNGDKFNPNANEIFKVYPLKSPNQGIPDADPENVFIPVKDGFSADPKDVEQISRVKNPATPLRFESKLKKKSIDTFQLLTDKRGNPKTITSATEAGRKPTKAYVPIISEDSDRTIFLEVTEEDWKKITDESLREPVKPPQGSSEKDDGPTANNDRPTENSNGPTGNGGPTGVQKYPPVGKYQQVPPLPVNEDLYWVVRAVPCQVTNSCKHGTGKEPAAYIDVYGKTRILFYGQPFLARIRQPRSCNIANTITCPGDRSPHYSNWG